ncbi:MAG: hypothetical protein NTW35_03435 [Candidatus Nomurabacteria bacterium]|nr:hypothetical protein [Candidatus Nomurabacteria bacterium]
MDPETIFQQLIKELGLEGVREEDQEETLLSLSKTIQKQFFLDAYERVGKDQFEALEASLKMGDNFYGTTLKHLIPDYEELFQSSRKKVIDSYKNAKLTQETTMLQ